MKINTKLLNLYLKKKLSTEEIVNALEQTEVEVEEILYSNKLDPKIIVAKIVEIKPHPNADRLKLTLIQTDAGFKKIVCGADNLKIGMLVAYAQVGTILPDGTEISKAKIRGENSDGMLCSELELGWGKDHTGIIELDPSLPLGTSLCDIGNFGDVLDIKTPSNRWDYLSYIGLAREIAAISAGNNLIEPGIREVQHYKMQGGNVKFPKECSGFYLVKVDVKVPPQSPRWLVDNLEASGMRSVNAVVDITNFVMLEYGQPSHAYDARKITRRPLVRFAKENESLITLDSKNLKLSSKDLLIVDGSKPIGLAGVIGGKKTETNTNTDSIWLEVANFDKTTVRRSAMRHGLRTEASTRFEKGLPLTLPHLALARLLQLLSEICQAEIIEGPYEYLNLPIEIPWLGMRLRRAERLLGYKIVEREVMEGLRKRGFEPAHYSFSTEAKKYLDIPYKYGAQYHSDGLEAFDCSYLTQTILAKAGIRLGRTAADQFDAGDEVDEAELKTGDLLFLACEPDSKKSSKTAKDVEHVGVYIGNKKVLQASSTKNKVVISPLSLFTKARNYLGARRYVKNFNHIISVKVPWWRTDISIEEDLVEETAKIIGYNNMPQTLPQLPPTDTSDHQILQQLMKVRLMLICLGLNEVVTYSFVSAQSLLDLNYKLNNHLQIENPLSSQQAFLRSSILPSHLQTAKNNFYQKPKAGIFEIARVYEKNKNDAKEKWLLAISVWGDQSLIRLKGCLDQLFTYYKLQPNFESDSDSNYIEGRYSKLSLDSISIARIGQVKPAILTKFDVDVEFSYFEVEIEKLINRSVEKSIKPLPPLPYQLVKRDLTIEIDNSANWQEIHQTLRNSASKVEFVGEFINEKLKRRGRKRVTMRLEFNLGPKPNPQQIENTMLKCHNLLKKAFMNQKVEIF